MREVSNPVVPRYRHAAVKQSTLNGTPRLPTWEPPKERCKAGNMELRGSAEEPLHREDELVAAGRVDATNARVRRRRRRHRMTRSGRAERLQREVASRTGVESADCVRSRTASAAALQRRVRSRLSVAVALLWPPERCGWGLPPTVVARILDYLPATGDAAAMREAAAAGNLARVREHLSLGVDPNAVDSGVNGVAGATALHWAVSGGHPATVITLLNAKADPRLPCAGMSGATALHLAAQSSEIRMSYPPRANSSLDRAQYHGMSRCNAEAQPGQWRRRQVIEALLRAGADPSLTTMGAGSLRRAQRRLCVCFALATWAQDMMDLGKQRSRRSVRVQPMWRHAGWFNVVIEKIVLNLPLIERTPAEKALEFHESTDIFSRWDWATATARSLSSRTRNTKKSTKASQCTRVPMLEVSSFVESNVHDELTPNIYDIYSAATAEDERKQILQNVHSRLRETYNNECRAKEERRERFRSAARLHLPPPNNKVERLTGCSIEQLSRMWVQTHNKLFAHTHSYPGLESLHKWATKNSLSDNDRLNLLESCCTRDPWNAGQQLVSMLDNLTKQDLRAFLDALPRTVILSGGDLGFIVDDRMVVTAVSSRSAIDAAGVRPGMMLLRIGRAPVGGITSFAQLQATVSMITPPYLCRFSATGGLSFSSMEEQVFGICDALHDQRKSDITMTSVVGAIRSAQQASTDDGVSARARSRWHRAAQSLEHTRSAPLALKALARGDRNSIAILSMHYARLRDERRDKLRASPRKRHSVEKPQGTLEERGERQRLAEQINEAFDALLKPEIDKQLAKDACASLGLVSVEDYLEGLWGAYGNIEVLPCETVKRCVVKRCLG